MENVRRRVDIRLCSTEEQARKLIAKSNFNRRTIFSENLMAVHLKKNPNQIFQTNTGEKQLNSSVGTKQLNSTGENNSTRQQERNNSTGENNSTQQQERTTQLGSRNETTQLVSRNETTQTLHCRRPPTTACNRLQRLQPPTTACNRLQPPTTACNHLQPPTTACNRLHRLYSRIGFFYLLLH
ncbi:hypothetical protein TNCV_2513121 [Trichonephila clavipes]|nr:hypothetical protein TNCV_2513121 [Trichonephila clavipes]